MTALARIRNPAWRGIWIGLACALASWGAVQWSLLRGLDDWMLDGCFSLRGQRRTDSHIVIIAARVESANKRRGRT